MAHTIVIFGASGDLTSRKLIPALYELFRKGRLPETTRIVGFARSKFSHDEWREKLTESTRKFAGDEFDAASWQKFAQSVFYHPGDVGQRQDFAELKTLLDKLEGGAETTRVYYLAMAPQFYETTAEQIGATSLADESRGTRRIVIEKPFGTDLATARAAECSRAQGLL